MNEQDGGCANQQQQFPTYLTKPRQQQQSQQPFPNHHEMSPDQQFMQHASTSYQNGQSSSMTQASYAGMTHLNQPHRYHYATDLSAGASSSFASATYPPLMNGLYGRSQEAQPSPPPNFHADNSQGQNISSRSSNGMVQPQSVGQQSSSALQNQIPQQHKHQQPHTGGQMATHGGSRMSHQLWDYANMPSPLQPSQSANQYVIESPYAPSMGTRERLAFSQSPMSDVFQSGGPSGGRTFNLMAGLGTPTPASPVLPICAQSTSGSPTKYFAASGTRAANLSLSSPRNSSLNDNGQQFSQWPAQPHARTSIDNQRQGSNSVFGLTSWNQTNQPYSNMQPSSVPSHVVQHQPTPSINSFAQHQPNARSAHQPMAQSVNPTGSSSASFYGDSSLNPMQTGVYAASSSTGSSLDAAWGAPPSRSSTSARPLPPSAQSMGQSHHMPYLTEPSSPSLAVARNQTLTPRHYAQPPPPQSLSSSSAASTLDTAMSASPNAVPRQPQPRTTDTAPASTAESAHPVARKPRKRKPKPKVNVQGASAVPPNQPSHPIITSSAPDSRPGGGYPADDVKLRQYAAPSELFARAPSATTVPLSSPKHSIGPIAMRHSEVPQTPPPPQAQTLSVQESPDPLNLLSPNGHFSLWQQPGVASLPTQPFADNLSAHRDLHPQQYGPTMARAEAVTAPAASKRKDSTSADKPKRKRSKKVKHESGQPTPAFNIKADDSATPSSSQGAPSADFKPPNPKKSIKSIKKDAERFKLEHVDPSRMPQITVDILSHALDSDVAHHNKYSPASSSMQQQSDQNEAKKRKKKRIRKSFSDIVNEIVEDSDSGADAEGSDWDDLNVLETWDVPVANEAEPVSEGPKSLAKMSNGPVKSSQRKVPVAKLQGLIEDLFEADDSLPDRDSLQDLLPGQSLSSVADHFFEIIESPSSSGGDSRSFLVLRAAALQKLLKLIVKCSRPHTEIAAMVAKPQPATNPGLSAIPATDVIRVLSILERTARAAELLDPFPSQARQASAPDPASPTKLKRGRKVDRQSESPTKTPEPAHTPENAVGEDGAETESSARPVVEAVNHPAHGDQESGSANEELEKLNATFAVFDRSVLATECSLGILIGDVLPKQILSEDHIRTCFEAVKTCLDKVILPFIEACSGSAANAPHPNLVSLIDVLGPQKARKRKAAPAPGDEPTVSIGIICRNTLADLFAHLCSALFFVQRMVRMPSIALSDSIVISAVYLALGPFFVLEPEAASGGASSESAKIAARGRSALLSLGGANSMKTLRLPALNLLRSIFAKAPDQRQWMVEEILTSLTKLTDMKKIRRQYSLRNGKGIHSINALLLQLIQAASHGVASYARSTADRLSRGKDGPNGDENGNGIDMIDAQADPERMQTLEVVIEAFNASNDPNTKDAREAEIAIWKRGLEGANASARSIAGYLMQRIGQTKVAKSSQEMSYAYVIESLIQDLLSALFLPEWPAAALMLSAFCRVFGTYLEDQKSHPDAKGVALEQLSLVAARIRQSQLQLQPFRPEAQPSPIEAQRGEFQDRGENYAVIKKPEPPSPSKRPKYTTWDYLSMLRALHEGDRNAIQEFVKAYNFISRFLAKASNEDLSMEGALEFVLVQAEGELATAWARVEEDKKALNNSEEDASVQIAKLQHFREELDSAMLKLSELDPTLGESSLVEFTPDDKMLERATDLSERVLISSSSMISYNVLRDLLVEGLNNPLIANRTKALRGIDRIAQVDPDLLDEDSMRSAIEVRLRDSSNAVRDSAVALFGSYLLRKPEHIPKYYKQVAARVLDTGLSVRKRMVRLLKSLHEATNDPKIRIDACARIIRCINDEDTLIQDMAALTIGEMWLDMDIDARRLYSRRRGSPVQTTLATSQPTDCIEIKVSDVEMSLEPVEESANPANGTQALDEDALEETEADKKVTDTIEIIMAVADVIKERPSPLEEVFRRLFKDKSEAEAAELHAKLQKLGDSMIDSLVESSGSSSVDTVKRIRIVQLLVSTNPAILTISKAKLLLPYLKAAQTSEEVQIMDLLLRIFCSCLPHMPKTAMAFAESLEKSLRPLVNRPPPKAGLHLLQELIACYCAVITTHTHNFRLLIQTLKACFVRVQSMRQMALKGQKVEDNKAWSTLMSLTASLFEHANFDEIRKKHPEFAPDIDALSKRPLIDVVSEALLDIYKTGSEAVRSVSLQNLGFLFRAHPTLMTRPSLTAMMDDIFASGSLQGRATLLKIILDFLSADSLRRNPDNAVVNAGTGRRKPENPDAGSVDMTILVGNTETFADTGVGSAMMQRYSEHVLKATLEVSNPSLQRTAIDILRFTVLQGLSHPIQCVPYLVSLETLEDRKIRSRAMELHSHLASKHASLVQARFLDTARSAFKFQLQLSTMQALRGFRVDNMPTAVLGAWYSLLRDRRATRLDFLKQIVKALDVNTAASDCGIEDVLFARFMADNLATLDYKTMEELFIIIGELRSILAVSGMQVLYMIQPHLPKRDAVEASAQAMAPEDGIKTPPLPTSAMGGDLVSPFGMARNPWLSGEWQLQLASDDAPPAHLGDTVDPAQIFGLPQSVPTLNGGAAHSSSDPAPRPTADKDDQDGGAGSVSKVDAITIANMSVISGTALLLRNHLKQLYGLSEARCAKFNPSKKQSAGADKPALMRALGDPMQVALNLGAMPFGLDEVKNEEDAQKQMLAYAGMVENEGTMMEPEDPDAFDDLAL
uniref:Sister chromatid cohesion protein n=1 Tax=Melanopsichium pennsylvanicum 4 TaxID=1398559 RepID=A0A077R8W1_9BASI|nr:related to proline-rich protein required for meiotic chromosome condensation and synapsis [Melanopsichium pennsylvanicum 4]